jgi:deazaflavin-dependent oxidoreductase (nitroreductase family)
MAIPRFVARFNKHVTNRILGPIVRFVPGYGLIVHRGRTSGRTYRTPIMAFRSADGRRLVFALTYGERTDWARNVLAAGVAGFESRRTGRLRLIEPRFVHDPARQAVPWPVRQVLRLLHVADFLETTIVS